MIVVGDQYIKFKNFNIINVESVYNADTNEITINNIEKITPGQIVTLEYDTTINSNIQKRHLS